EEQMPTTTRATRLMTLHALTFLHPGTGQTTGVVDLPVQREVHTGFPMIASSGLKGALREKAERKWKDSPQKVHVVFGPEGSEAAGALTVTDGRILALPVRSLQKVFLWVTCPMVLERLARDAKLAGVPLVDVPSDTGVDTGKAVPSENSGLQPPLVLEELRMDLVSDTGKQGQCGKLVTELKRLAPTLGQAGLDGRLVIISNEDFQYFCRHALQVSARIALNERKTTTGDGGNLWYEETLPPETVLYALLLAHKPRFKPQAAVASGAPGVGADTLAADGVAPPQSWPKDAPGVISEIHTLLNGQYVQVGGNETVGQGWCQVALTPEQPS
ncbi:MAG: type III-B CRISPR module RAMP protein Cmr4, partial [Anaerolineales bacterium]